jgi:hypothetical protein
MYILPNFKLSQHIIENRNTSKLSRIEYINDSNIKYIIKEAFKEGLTSFRNKGLFVISIKLENSKNYYNFLCNLKDNELVFITCVVNQKFWKSFKRVPNRINLLKTFLPRLNDVQKTKLKKERIMNKLEKELINEDKLFLNAMNLK